MFVVEAVTLIAAASQVGCELDFGLSPIAMTAIRSHYSSRSEITSTRRFQPSPRRMSRSRVPGKYLSRNNSFPVSGSFVSIESKFDRADTDGSLRRSSTAPLTVNSILLLLTFYQSWRVKKEYGVTLPLLQRINRGGLQYFVSSTRMLFSE